jgi:hypothetical protein
MVGTGHLDLSSSGGGERGIRGRGGGGRGGGAEEKEKGLSIFFLESNATLPPLPFASPRPFLRLSCSVKLKQENRLFQARGRIVPRERRRSRSNIPDNFLFRKNAIYCDIYKQR